MNRITATLLCLVLCLAGTSLHATAFAGEQTSVSAPSVPSPAAPAQVVALKTPVAPPPLTRPFPAPVTTRTVTVPASIDATGASDVYAELDAFIVSVPDGSIINFPSTGIYRIDRGIWLKKHHNLIIDGNGCTLKYVSVTGTGQGYSFWYDSAAVGESSGSDIWIRNFVLIGSSTHPGVYTPGSSPTGGEGQHGFIIRSNRYEVSGCTISAVWGDGFYLMTGALDVWIHDNHVISAGRNGLSVILATNVIAERNAFDKSGGSAFDVEPEHVTDTCTNIIFRNNTIGTFGTEGSGFDPNAFAISNVASALIDGVVIDGNIVMGNSIGTYMQGSSARITRITFTNNKGEVTAAGSVIYFLHVDGLTVIGNVQPLGSGVLASITDCTGGGNLVSRHSDRIPPDSPPVVRDKTTGSDADGLNDRNQCP